jgi:LysM repeat protein
MKALRSGILGVLAAVLSGMFVFSILSLAVVEGMITLPPTITLPATLLPPNLTPIPVLRITTTALWIHTSTQPPQPTQCPHPEGWLPYLVQPGDSLADLAVAHGLSLDDLMNANCLISSQLVTNASIYLPPTPTASATVLQSFSPTACLPPAGWVLYTIKSGDTLSIISQRFQISLAQLMQANCLTNEYIIAGRTLWVPNVPTSTPNISFTMTPTQTQPPPQPSYTFTPTSSLTPTLTNSPPVMTSTPTPSQTSSETPSETPTITATETPNPGQTKKTETGTNTP